MNRLVIDATTKTDRDATVATDDSNSVKSDRRVAASSTASATAPAPQKPAPAKPKSRAGMYPNNVRKLRQEAMMSKAELARRAGVSPLTINRVEAGCPCRMDTKRKILEALGIHPSERSKVFGPDVDKQN